MALLNSFEKAGNLLFRYRGQIPVILFISAIPVLYFTNYNCLNSSLCMIINVIAVIISITGFCIRAYTIGTTPKGTSGRNTKEQVAEKLNTSGIYSIVRHPLYLGNYLIWIGIVIFTYNIYFIIIVSLAFWLFYERIMYAEERFLERKFGNEFLFWTEKIPAFIPSFTNYRKSSIPFSFKSVLRREYSGVLATVIGYTFVDILRQYFINNDFTYKHLSVYVLIIILIIVLIIRTIKHSTNLLQEEGRS